MSLSNPIDYTGFSSPFRADLVANQRNRADAHKKAGAYKRAGELGSTGLSTFGKAVGQGFLDDAGAYAAAQQRGANMFSGIAGAVGMVGGMGASGMFDPSKTFHNNSLFGQTKFGAGGGTLPDVFGNKVGTLGPNYGIPQ